MIQSHGAGPTQLSEMERATGIEPAMPGWKPGVSPQHFARVNRAGLEPATSWLRTR